ncbi:MAG: 23S rRNA (adenine(1618)-N(6))-methyltransferase RlmF [Bacteriovorax sp.]|nr:23S rRNA (adenine(1618)-N(6))-methyltransferase RlmF [Bacteriovorax sp.]
MKNEIKPQQEIKPGLHPRNRHNSRYDFSELTKSCPELLKFIAINKYNDESIDFANPEAVKSLNQAILKYFYNITNWNIPKNYLCPPIPGRADYIHQIADLLGSKNGGVIPKGESIRVLDIGVGASCVYPLIANSEYGWKFVGSDIDAVAINSAKQIVDANNLSNSIQLRLQTSPENIFKGIIHEQEFFDITISNPPFHSSLEEAQEGNQRKTKNLGRGKDTTKKDLRNTSTLNFGGVSNELWCTGGEVAFATRMIDESVAFKNNCFWFSTLISKFTSLPFIYEELKKAGVQDFKTIDMAQGQKKSRIVVWTFLGPNQQKEWRNKQTK